MRAIKLLPVAAIAAIFLLPLPASAAEGEGFESVPEGETIRAEAEKPEKERIRRFDQEEEYRRLLKEYERALNEAESDLERRRLLTDFQEKTRQYRGLLEKEEKARQERTLGEKRRMLEEKFVTEKRLLRQGYEKKSRQIDRERDSRLSGVFENWTVRERALEKKKHLLDEDYRRRLKSLEQRHKERLEELE